MLVDLLVQHRANLDIQTRKGETALHYAVFLQRKDVVLALLKGGANVTIKGKISCYVK